MKRKIQNIYGENLDVLIEGNENSNKILLYVHGFGTDKNEGFASFLDCADYLKDDFLTIRFDLSGYGESEGKDYEFQFHKAAGDVDSVIRYAKEHYKNKEINILAHSLGTFVVSILSPYMIAKTVFTSIPNSNTDFIIKQLKNRILSKGGIINEEAISSYPRTSGAMQLIGKDFWRTLGTFEPCKYIEELGTKTNLIIFKPIQDDVLDYKYFEEYKSIPNVKYIEIKGNHNFTDAADRLNLFKEIRSFLQS